VCVSWRERNVDDQRVLGIGGIDFAEGLSNDFFILSDAGLKCPGNIGERLV
jgi:hypothetical protein